MALLIFPPENLTPPLAAILDPALRRSVANRVNEAILSSQGAQREARIKGLVRLRLWAEFKAREAKKDVPADLSLGFDPKSGSTAGGVDFVGYGEGIHDHMES